MPTVSVIMPCFNAGRFVADSVNAVLAQSLDDLELIVVDDASTDNSVELLSELAGKDTRVKLILHERNLGASRSRNDGLQLANGPYIAFCDADDIWKPEKLHIQITALQANPLYDITYCDSEIIDEIGSPTGCLFSDRFPVPRNPSGNLFTELCKRNFINMQTVLMRSNGAASRMLFDENIKWVEDWWLWITLSRKSLYLYDPRALALYRVHSQSTSTTQRLGIPRNRWKVCMRNLRLNFDMPREVRADIWYQMALDLKAIGRRRAAQSLLWKALCSALFSHTSIRRLLIVGVRLASGMRLRKVTLSIKRR